MGGEDKGLVVSSDAYLDRIKYHVRKEKKGYGGVDMIGSEDLRHVKPDDALYIAGHGESGNENIYGNVRQHPGHVLSASQLAAQFIGRLDKNHKRIKVWVCHSGDGMTCQRGLAYRFWEAMHPHFPNLTVFGYRYAVIDPFWRSQEHTQAAILLEGFRSPMETPEKIQWLPGTTQHWRTGIDPLGKIIPPKPLPRIQAHSGADDD